MAKKKPHKFKSIDGAVRRVRELERQLVEYKKICERLDKEKRVLAKLASDKPEFFNPLAVAAAKEIRDEVLAIRRLIAARGCE